MTSIYTVYVDGQEHKTFKQLKRAERLALSLMRDHSSVFIRDNFQNVWRFK